MCTQNELTVTRLGAPNEKVYRAFITYLVQREASPRSPAREAPTLAGVPPAPRATRKAPAGSPPPPPRSFLSSIQSTVNHGRKRSPRALRTQNAPRNCKHDALSV
ncbi:hypothetical protein O0L34_g13644 [Tuta absoluta]|nr:hypothetical protein O0L34_g13644 [Tuta absoluta]